jgi:hypothetical protein
VDKWPLQVWVSWRNCWQEWEVDLDGALDVRRVVWRKKLLLDGGVGWKVRRINSLDRPFIACGWNNCSCGRLTKENVGDWIRGDWSEWFLESSEPDLYTRGTTQHWAGATDLCNTTSTPGRLAWVAIEWPCTSDPHQLESGPKGERLHRGWTLENHEGRIEQQGRLGNSTKEHTTAHMRFGKTIVEAHML